MEKINLFKEMQKFCEERGFVYFISEVILDKVKVKLTFEDSEGMRYSSVDVNIVNAFESIREEIQKQDFLNCKCSIKELSPDKRFEKFMAFTKFASYCNEKMLDYIDKFEYPVKDTNLSNDNKILVCVIVAVKNFLYTVTSNELLNDFIKINKDLEIDIPPFLMQFIQSIESVNKIFDNITNSLSIIFTEKFSYSFNNTKIIFHTEETDGK